MRRNVRKRINQDEDLCMKIIKYSCIGISILAIIVFALLMYSKSLNDEVKEGTLTSEQISSILNNTGNTTDKKDTESASTEMGKNVNEAKADLTNNTVSNSAVNSTKTNSSVNQNVLSTSNVTSTKTENKVKEEQVEKKEETEDRKSVV